MRRGPRSDSGRPRSDAPIGSLVPSHRAAIPLSDRPLNRLADPIRAERRSRWRRLDPGPQALLVLAHQRNGDTYARLAGGFVIGTTAWRYVRESVDLPAAPTDDLR